MKSFSQFKEEVSNSELNALQKKADLKLKKHKIDLDIKGNHFRDRINDPRNKPDISADEISSIIDKIDGQQGKKIKAKKGSEAVLKDKKSKINIPAVIKPERDRSGKEMIAVKAKTIMRKKNFQSKTPFIAYEGNNSLEESKLAKMALIGAIVLGVAAGNAAQVSSRDVKSWKQDFNSLTVQNKRKVLGLIGKSGDKK